MSGPRRTQPPSTSESSPGSSSRTESSLPTTRNTTPANYQEEADPMPSPTFLAEVDEWLNQISKQVEELERRHRAHLSIEIKWTPEMKDVWNGRKQEKERRKKGHDVTINKA
ncbi:hypothetical protein NLJ89_g2474 [Agrocybe chaxingu]|uniref:Uncharacterized protein n=1 Tax=Agrocybe chaxingu TaxID=84603 RepID=A0A9W8K6I2_9AGAR|nr:hypothetical protein NLJ89_g2474 [Agrocybe chaxingu]